MPDTPETIYLIPGETWDSMEGLCWCEEPAPESGMDPAEAVEYLRKDKHDEIIARQAKAANQGMDAAKRHALSAEDNARRLLAASSPEALESERAANEILTERVEQLEVMVKIFRGCIDTRGLPAQDSPCHKKIHELVGERD